MRFRRQPARHAQSKANFVLPLERALHCGQTNVVDFRISAPHTASGDADLELAGEVVKLIVAGKELCGLVHQRRSVADFLGIHARERAARHIADHIAACAKCIETHLPQTLQNLGKRLNGDPVQLNVLPHGNVGHAARVFFGQHGNRAQLVRVEHAIGDANAQHEKRQRLAFPALAA